MGIARDLVRGLKSRVLGNMSEKLVSNLADTSSDAPNKFAAPKRDLYDKLRDEGKLDEAKKDR